MYLRGYSIGTVEQWKGELTFSGVRCRSSQSKQITDKD